MAITMTNFCPACKTEVREMRPNNDYDPTCMSCRQKIATEKREKWLADRAALPVEERLRLIEEWIYDHERKPSRDVRSMLF